MSPSSETPLARLERESLTETERRVAWLRLAAVPVIAAGQQLPSREPLTAEFLVTIGVFCLYSLGALVWVYRLPVTRRFALAVTALDLVGITAAVAFGGGVFSQVHDAFFLLPIAVAFRFQPRLTLVAAATTIAVYALGAFWFHPHPHMPGSVKQGLFQTAVLAWFSIAAIWLSAVLKRRTVRVGELAAGREQLLADTLSVEERERRTIAEGLHDSVLQNLLSVQHDLQEATDDAPHPALVRAEHAVAATLATLRETVSELHPYVLEQAGLEVALRAVGERAAQRARATLRLDLQYGQRHPHEGVLFMAASELLANVVTHSNASTIRVRLRLEGADLVLGISDDGDGFDLSTLDERLAEGHIGLASQRVRIETIGGRLDVVSERGSGTSVEIHVPA
ncbi:MAG: ATP-binding protein [Actinomycetota bacterium]|nr:ATP-binding protein [Actinomycetota bacterium]